MIVSYFEGFSLIIEALASKVNLGLGDFRCLKYTSKFLIGSVYVLLRKLLLNG